MAQLDMIGTLTTLRTASRQLRTQHTYRPPHLHDSTFPYTELTNDSMTWRLCRQRERGTPRNYCDTETVWLDSDGNNTSKKKSPSKKPRETVNGSENALDTPKDVIMEMVNTNYG